jgi:undecaprenyl-diphosphatase
MRTSLPQHAARYARYLAPGRVRDFARREFVTLIVLALVLGGVWVFLEVADEVVEGDTASFDERILLWMRTPGDTADPLGPDWFEEAARDVTALGSTVVQALLTLAVVGFLMIQRKYHATVFVCVAVIGGVAISQALKLGFSRPRPELVSHGMDVFTASFPSGHSMTSAATYLVLGALLARLQPTAVVKSYVMSLAVGIALLVGLSRVYLGVHWPTDVVAGWAAGSAWALACWLMMRWLQRRGRVEEEHEQTSDLSEPV